MTNIGYYRKEMERQQGVIRQTILDEIEGEVNRLKDFVDSIDLDSIEELQGGVDRISKALRELSEKLY